MRPIPTCLAVLAISVTSAVHAAELTPQAFAEKAAMADMFEIESSKLVLDKGSSERVREYAKMMIEHHTANSQNLRDAASKEGIDLPAALDAELQEKLDALKPLADVALDAAYVSAQVSVHTQAVDVFGQYASSGPGGALKSFAQAAFPTIRMHLVRVRAFNIEE